MIELAAQDSTVRALLLLGIFGIVAGLSLLALFYGNRRIAVRGQLDQLSAKGIMLGETIGSSHTESLRTREAQTAWARLAAAVERAGLNLTDTKSERLSSLLRQAGFPSPAAPRVFTLVRLGMIFVLPLLYVVIAFSGDDPPSFLKTYLVGSVLALIGLYLPNLYIRARADRRKEAIINGFPDCLDLLLVCVESGLGLEAAMDRVGREMVNSHPLVAELLMITVLQLRAGATRDEAFRKLADASAVDEIRAFTTLIIQSDKLGTSVANTLRVYAAEMREKRQMRAEEKAHRLPVLISIPLVACMLPTMIGTLMLPAAVLMVRKIFPMMTGG
ncbi:type II secretion system F family protein [Altererythrobacter aerius]|uniref:Type II secretion system F family protein n=1 Tax=Tsuneonella aeria TaxID=1837929 RepID=A0A6I4TGS7_9SPHN|nr:type II secretion system F family protein [Tsuneonella aeria]MXO75240.1 type II secretion system F family protein [Tsuneonella aeria]